MFPDLCSSRARVPAVFSDSLKQLPLGLHPFGNSGVMFVRFSLVDRILALEPGRSIKTVKNLSIAEEYLADHFPGFPVMPGVLMIESLVQAGGWLMRETEGFKYSTILLKEVRAVKFNNFVKPGFALTVECEVSKQEGNLYTFKGTGTVDGASAVSAKITLEQFNLSDRNPDLRKSDELRIKKLQELFACLWQVA